MTITSLAFLTPGNFADDAPYIGLEETIQLFVYGEELGYDGAWIRQRHLEHGVGSAAVFLARGRLSAATAAAAQPRAGEPHLVRRRQPALGPSGRRARPQPALRPNWTGGPRSWRPRDEFRTTGGPRPGSRSPPGIASTAKAPQSCGGTDGSAARDPTTSGAWKQALTDLP